MGAWLCAGRPHARNGARGSPQHNGLMPEFKPPSCGGWSPGGDPLRHWPLQWCAQASPATRAWPERAWAAGAEPMGVPFRHRDAHQHRRGQRRRHPHRGRGQRGARTCGPAGGGAGVRGRARCCSAPCPVHRASGRALRQAARTPVVHLPRDRFGAPCSSVRDHPRVRLPQGAGWLGNPLRRMDSKARRAGGAAPITRERCRTDEEVCGQEAGGCPGGRAPAGRRLQESPAGHIHVGQT